MKKVWLLGRLFYNFTKPKCHSFISYQFQGASVENKNMNQEDKDGIPLVEAVRELNKFADLRLAEPWDNVGLLIEPTNPTRINNVLLTNDLTELVLDEALQLKTNLIISYHPPIFAPLKRITNATWKERIVATCLENRIAVYSPHTSWDAKVGGVTDWLIKAFDGEFEESKTTCLTASPPVFESEYMIEVIVPQLNDIFHVANSSEIISCSDACQGRKIYKIKCKKSEINKFLKLECSNVVVNKIEEASDPQAGMGRLIQVSGLTLSVCLERLKNHLNLKHLRLAFAVGKTLGSEVKNIAFVPGSGGSLLKGVKADLYVTGEMFHHDILEANHNGSSVILTNHSDSERGFLDHMKQNLQKIFPNIDIFVSSKDKDPLQTF